MPRDNKPNVTGDLTSSALGAKVTGLFGLAVPGFSGVKTTGKPVASVPRVLSVVIQEMFDSVAAGATVGAAPAPSPSPAPSGGAQAFSLLSATTGAAVPYSVGFAFRRGAIPSGSGVVSDHGTLQVTPKNQWPDGSLKFAVLAGTADLTGGTPRTITLSAGTSSTGTALTTADLIATGITASIDAGAFGAASFGNTEWGSPFRSWASGHQMSSWIYRKPIGSDAHLVAWLEVRLHAGGAVEVLPWVENGYLKVASPTNKSATYSFTLGGTVRNGGGQAIDLKHHQRAPLVAGAALSYWLSGTDPGVTVKHDAAYLMSTELVPTYWASVAPGASLVTGLPGTFTPLQPWAYNYSGDGMASSGYQHPIGLLPLHDVVHLTTTADTYAAVVREGYSAGRWGTHYRDENTNKPVRFQDRPNLVIADSQGFKDNGSSTTSDRTTVATGGNPPQWDTAHSPSVGYLAYLITGRFYFMEEVQFAATCNFLGNGDNAALRNGVQGLVQTAVDAWQTRSCAWDWRSKIQALTVTPDSGAGSEIRTDLINCVEANIAHFHGRYVAQANNPFGLILPGETYGGVIDEIAIWQQEFVTASFGWSVSMDLPIGATPKSNLAAFFQWKAKSTLITLGRPGVSAEWPYYNSSPYTIKLGGSARGQSAWTTGTGPWPADAAAILTATTTPSAPTWFASNDGLLTFEFQPTPDEACKGVFANRLPALAYAVRHGVPGARDAFYRLTSAANWPVIEAALGSRPVWGVRPASGWRPTWAASAAALEVVTAPNSSGGGGAAVDPWGALWLMEADGRVGYSASGGHGDSFDNRVTSFDLHADSPSGWTPRIASYGSTPPINVTHYPDGSPCSRHSYHYVHYIRQIGKVVLPGARGMWGSGNDSQKFDAHSTSGTWAWDAANTYADVPLGHGAVVDPLTGNILTNAGRLWNRAANTWSTLNSFTGGWRYPLCYDFLRDRYFALQWGDGGPDSGSTGMVAAVVNKTTGVGTAITFNASAAYTQWLADDNEYSGLVHDWINDRFLFYDGRAGRAGRLYVITPNAGTVWDMSLLSLTGVSIPASPGAGINRRLVFIPTLRMVLIAPTGAGSLYAFGV